MHRVSYDKRSSWYRAEMARVDDPTFYRQALGQASRVLEIPCGAGHSVRHYRGFRGEAVLADVSREMVKQTGDEVRRLRLGSTCLVVRGNLLHTARLGRFDAVICACDALRILPSIHQVERVFRSIYATLEPGGFFWLWLEISRRQTRPFFDVCQLEAPAFTLTRARYTVYSAGREVRHFYYFNRKRPTPPLHSSVQLLRLTVPEVRQIARRRGFALVAMESRGPLVGGEVCYRRYNFCFRRL